LFIVFLRRAGDLTIFPEAAILNVSGAVDLDTSKPA
jgi:hypothetical protein